MISIEPSVDLDPDEVRFFSKVNLLTESGCWSWQLAPSGEGYGVFSLNGRNVKAHRYVLKIVQPERIVPRRVVDHLCRNRMCVRPDHLEVVTNRENVLRGFGSPAQNARKVQCSRGHDLVPENLYSRTDRRDCKLCARIRAMKNRPGGTR